MDDIRNEGSITFWLQHDNKDWTTNSHGYNFGSVSGPGVMVEASKHPDKTVQLEVDGPLDQQFNLQLPIPECDDRGLFVAITWKHPELKVYLNGTPVETVTI